MERRGAPSGGRRPGEQCLGLVATDPTDDLDAPWQVGVLGELDDGPGRALARICDRIHESLDIALQQCPDAHRAWLVGREDRRVGEPDSTKAPGRFAQGKDHRMGRRVVRLLDSVMGSRDHRLVDHGDGGDRSLTAVDRELRLRESLAHEQFVVHLRMLTDGP